MKAELVEKETQSTEDHACYHSKTRYEIAPQELLKGKGSTTTVYLVSSTAHGRNGTTASTEMRGSGGEHFLEPGRSYRFFADECPTNEEPLEIFRVEELTQQSPEEPRKSESQQQNPRTLTSLVSRIRGVSSSFLFTREGTLIDSHNNEDRDPRILSEFIKKSVQLFQEFSEPPSHWFLQFDNGMLVVDFLGDDQVVVLLGGERANYGAVVHALSQVKKSLRRRADDSCNSGSFLSPGCQ